MTERNWHISRRYEIIHEDCPLGEWTNNGWPVKVGSKTCTEDCEYCESSEMAEDKKSGKVICNYEETK